MAAETVDTRVVEAKFDSKQFEQGVDRTVKKLDELKKSLNLKDGEKSVAEIGNKISDTSEKASESLEKLEKRFTSFFGMLKQKLVSGIADEIVGSIFKVKNAINGLVTSLSTGQIGYGMQRYTDILTSVRTLTASGVNEGAAYETIERLGEYADQTSYSLDQLVSTMSKFKTAGADLGTAQRMVEGLSNAAASMGVNAQDAARAYLNLQQAYSKGKMTQADWISFESLPMVGEKFNQAIIDAAVKVGTLKQNAKGTYEVVSKAVKAAGGTGGRVSGAAAKGITAENMGSKLASGWFNKQVMEEVFGSTYYFAEVGIDEVNAIKEEERKIRADVKKDIANAKIAEADYDKEVTSRLEEYFKERNKVVIDEKKAEIEARKESAKADLDSRKIVKEEYDKLIKDLDKEMKDFEANNHLSAFAYQAFTAGQEARSFTDVLNTLKDTISRGWATSFELIFGKLDEAKDFFTSLTESQLAEGIYAIGEFRNAVLENWRNSGGRESLLGLLEYMDSIAGSIWKKLGLINDEEKWFNDNFDQQKYNQILKQEGKEQAEAYKEQVRAQASAANPFEQTAKELGQRLSILTRNIQDFFEKVHKWFTEADSTGTSRLQRISNILEGFGTIGRGALYAVGQGLEFIGKVYNTFKTSFDALWRAIDNISQKVFAVFNPDIKTDGFNIFTALTDTFENILTVLRPLNEPLTKLIGILEDVAGFFVDMGISSILMNIQFFTDGFALLLEVLGLGSSQQARGAGVLDGIVRDIKDLGESCKSAMTAVGDFFKSLFDDLRILLGLKEDQNGEKHGIFANIENWFNTNEFVQKVKARIDKAIKDIGDFIKDIPNRIVNIGINIGDFFKGIFYYKTSVANSGVTWIKKPLTKWLENAANTVWNFVTVDIPKFVKGIPDIVGNFFNSLFYTKQTAKKSANGFYTYTDTRTPLKKWLDQAILDAKNFIKSIPEKLKKIPSIIEEFFKSIFYYKTSVANSGVTWVKKPFTQWIDENIVKNLKTFITELPTYIGQAIGTVSNFAGQVVSAIFGKEDGSPVTADDVTEGIRKPFLGVNVTGVINSIKGVAKRILSGIASAFTGETDWESNKNWLAEGAANLLKEVQKKADEAWTGVSNFFTTLPEKVKSLFESGEAHAEGNDSTIGSAALSFAAKVGEWISKIPDMLLSAWKSAEVLSSGLWKKVAEWIFGGSAVGELRGKYKDMYDDFLDSPEGRIENAQEDVKNRYLKMQWREDNPIAANISDFFVHLGDYFKEKILAIPGQIAGIASNAWDVLSAVKDVIFGTVNEEKYKNKDDSNPLYTATVDVFNSIVKFVTDNASTIGNAIKAGWNKAVTIGSIIGEVLFGNEKPVFDPKEYAKYDALGSYGHTMAEAYKHSTKDYGIYNGVASFFENIKNWVLEQARNLPSKIAAGIRTAVDFAKQVGPSILEGLQSVLTWVTGKVNKVTETINNAHAEGKSIFDIIKEKLSGKSVDGKEITDPTEKTLWNVVQDIGKSLKTFIVDTIPKFISSAFEEIKMDLPKLINKIFGSDESSNSEDIPKEIGNDVTGYAQKQYEDYVKTNAKKNKSLWDQIIDLLIPSASADELEDVSKEATGKAEQQQEQDKKTLIDKIKDKLGGFGGIIDIIKGVSTAVGSFLSSDVGKYLLLGLVISSILSTIADIMSLTDEVNALKDKSKWDAIKVAVLGLIAIIGYISYLAATDTNQLATTKQALYDLADALQKILAPIEIIMGIMAAGKLGDALGKFFEWREEKVKSKNDSSLDDDESLSAMKKWGLDRAGSLIDKVEDTLLGPAKKLLSLGATAIGGEWIGSMFEMISGNINDAMGEFGSGMSLLSTNIITVVNNLNSVSSELTTAIDTLGPIKTLIIEMVGLISTTFDKEEINEAGNIETTKTSIISEMGTANKAFTELSGSLSLFKNSVSGYGEDATAVSSALEKILGSKGSMKDFADFVNNNSKDWETFKKALTSLGAIFHLYSNSLGETFNEKPKDLNIENAVEFLNKLFGNEKFKSLIITFSESTLPEINNKNVENAENIIIFAASLSAIAKACAEIKGDEATSINTLFEVINQVKIGKDDKEIQSVAQKFGILGNALGSFALNTAGLTMENLQNAERALRMLTTISIELGKTPDDSWFSKFIYGDKGIDVFSIKISEVGQNLKVFFDSIDALDANGQSRTYNPVNLESVFEVLDVFTKAAQRLSPKYFDDQTFSYFTSFLGVLTKETLTAFAENINAFLKEISKLNDNGEYNLNNNDFEYIDKVVSYINSLSIIVKRVSSLQFTNLGDLDEIVPENNPLVKYISKIMDGMNLLGLKLPAYEQGLGYIKKYQVELQMYTNMVSDIVKIMSFSRKGLALSSEETAAKITDVVNAMFGWNTKDFGIENHHEGVFEKVLGFLNSTKEYEESLEEASSVTKSKDIFMGISDMISGFTRAISDIAKADSVAGIHGFIQSEYSSYVTKLAGVLQSMLDNKQVFVDFFNFGGQFNSAYVKNISMITDTLNSMVQMIATLHSLGPGEFNVESIEDLYDWPHLFDVMTDLIMGDNQDFFSPKIAPVLDITDDFKSKAEELRKTMGFILDANGNWISPSYSVSISGIDIPEVNEISRKLDKLNTISDGIDTLKTNTELFRSDLRNMKFIINGEELTTTLLPTFDTALNVASIVAARAAAK